MNRLANILALARAEARLTRRLVRYWVFQVLALVFGVIVFWFYSWVHGAFSHWSATAAVMNPRFLLGFIGMYYLSGFLLGLVFLGYDVRARDARERMAEVLDSRPYSNLELLLGRYLGILIPCWVPVLVVSLVLVLFGMAIGSSIEPVSVATFVLAMAIPGYSFVLGLVFLLTVLLRHRLLAAVACIALIVGWATINIAFVPVYLLPAVDITGAFSVPGPSDIIPQVVDGRAAIQRLGILLAGLGLLWLAAACHPRRDHASRGLTTATGFGLIAVGGALLGIVVAQGTGAMAQVDLWKQAHESRRDDPAPDVQSIRGTVNVDAGRSLGLELQLVFAAPEDAPLQSALFSLNPGMEVRSATSAGGQALPFDHDDGLFEVRLPRTLAAGETFELDLVIDGMPEMMFSYLDAVMNPLTVNIQAGNIFLLGFYSYIYDPRFVALMPGTRWLPASGAEIGRGDPGSRPLDFFEIDLEVRVPEGWLVAGPGRREPLGDAGGQSRFRFQPPAPLPEVALIGGRLVGRSVEIDGVTLEVLVAAKHEGNLEFFADAAEEIEGWLSLRLSEAVQLGLRYPYDALTLVEVPSALRGYAGGWRMDTTLTQPALVLMRESSFPTARFDKPFEDPDRYADQEGGIPRAKLEMLERFFENDFSGGNPFVGAARSFFSYQTFGRGESGLPLNYVWEDLSTRLVTDKQGYFSIHHYGTDMQQTISGVFQAMFQNPDDSLSDALITTVTQRTDVWESVLETSLRDLDPWEAPKRAVDVLTLKGNAMSRSIMDDLGVEKTAQLLSGLRERTAGGSFDREDVLAVGQEIGADLEGWLDIWLDETRLPGFTVPRVELFRLNDSEAGTPRFQILLTVDNDETAPGLLRVEYHTGSDDQAERGFSAPIRVPADSAVEIGVVTSNAPTRVRVVPYLALNRTPFGVPLPSLDQERVVDAEPFIGARGAERLVDDDPAIVVDDLDPGFTVESSEGQTLLRIAGKRQEAQEFDQGLPVGRLGRRIPQWSRFTESTAFGKYRHTMAMIRKGEGKQLAVFQAELPRSGRWEIEYHLPRKWSRSRAKRGVWNMELADSSGTQEITFNADVGEVGWNSLGTFELASGTFRLVVSDKTDGRYVLADAVRIAPVGGSPDARASLP